MKMNMNLSVIFLLNVKMKPKLNLFHEFNLKSKINFFSNIKLKFNLEPRT